MLMNIKISQYIDNLFLIVTSACVLKKFLLITTSTFKTDKYAAILICFILLAGLPVLVFEISITENVYAFLHVIAV